MNWSWLDSTILNCKTLWVWWALLKIQFLVLICAQFLGFQLLYRQSGAFLFGLCQNITLNQDETIYWLSSLSFLGSVAPCVMYGTNAQRLDGLAVDSNNSKNHMNLDMNTNVCVMLLWISTMFSALLFI